MLFPHPQHVLSHMDTLAVGSDPWSLTLVLIKVGMCLPLGLFTQPWGFSPCPAPFCPPGMTWDWHCLQQGS